MAFPKLIKKSKNLAKIPYPEDFGLDSIVEHIFLDNSSTNFDDYVQQIYRGICDRIVNYARNIILYPETDTDTIKSRQQVLQYFMDNHDLVDLVFNKSIPIFLSTDVYEDSEKMFDNRINRAEVYLEYLAELSEKLPDSKNNEITNFKIYIGELLTKGERVESLRKALLDIQNPAKLELSAKAKAKTQPFIGTQSYDLRGSAKAKLSSGKIQKSNICSFAREGSYDLGMPLNSILVAIFDQVKSNTGRNLLSLETPFKLEIFVDQETGKINGTASYEKLRIFKSLFSLSKKTKEIVTELDLESKNINADHFEYAIKHLKTQEYTEFLKSYFEEFGEFAEAVTELRYLSTAAKYFNNLKNKGVAVAMPKIEEQESKRTYAKGLLDPNLARKIGFEKTVRNDVDSDASKNIFIITGPNNNGKSTYLNSLGSLQSMAQAGLMVYAKNSEVSPKDNIFTHYIKPGDLSRSESRYAHDLLRTKEIMQKATGNSLILMNESCSGTSPHDGKIQLENIVLTIGKLGATAFVETHFHNLINTADRLPYADNLECFSREENGNLIYTYRIISGFSTSSNGLYLAKEMGVDREGMQEILKKRAEKEGLKLRQ